jgi:hypothetical protein
VSAGSSEIILPRVVQELQHDHHFNPKRFRTCCRIHKNNLEVTFLHDTKALSPRLHYPHRGVGLSCNGFPPETNARLNVGYDVTKNFTPRFLADVMTVEFIYVKMSDTRLPVNI